MRSKRPKVPGKSRREPSVALVASVAGGDDEVDRGTVGVPHIVDRSLISLGRMRKLLGPSCDLDSRQLEELRQRLYVLADVVGTMIFSPSEKRKWMKYLDTIPGVKVYDAKA